MLRLSYAALMALWVVFVAPGLLILATWRAFWRAWARVWMTFALVKFMNRPLPSAWDEACRRFD